MNSGLWSSQQQTIIVNHNSNGDETTREEGEVVNILTRGIKKLVGTFQGENGFGFVIPDERAFFVDVYVPFKLAMGAKTGDKVVVEIVSYPEGRKNPEGRVVEILGKKNDFKTEELSIIKNAGYDLEFPSSVKKVLKDMNRRGDKQFLLDLFKKIKNRLKLYL